MAETKEYITNTLENGTINISEEVIATIAATAVKDVEGVVSLAGSDVSGILTRKNANKGIRIVMDEDAVEVYCNLMVLYGHSVVEIAKNVQNGVTTAIESMTGLHVRNVDVTVSGISMAKA